MYICGDGLGYPAPDPLPHHEEPTAAPPTFQGGRHRAVIMCAEGWEREKRPGGEVGWGERDTHAYSAMAGKDGGGLISH